MKKLKDKKRAFTLVEMLATMALIGVLAAILMPILSSVAPSTDKVLIRKCFYITKSIIYTIINDPSKSNSSGLDGVALCPNFKENLNIVIDETLTCPEGGNGQFATTQDDVKWFYDFEGPKIGFQIKDGTTYWITVTLTTGKLLPDTTLKDILSDTTITK